MTTIADLLNDLYMEAYNEGVTNGVSPQRALDEDVKKQTIEEYLEIIKERIIGS